MKNSLCSRNFRNFFSSIDKIGLSIEELAELIRENIPIIADDLELGRLSIVFFSPPSPLEENGNSAEITVFEKPSNDSQVLTDKFLTTGGGNVTFNASPAEGIVWDETGQEEISFLFKNLFAMCGRARLSGIVKKALSSDIATGLANANGLVTTGNIYASQGILKDYTAMYLNLRNFKYINGQIGNKYGDAVIKAYATALARNAVDGEIIARLGGDNFAILVRSERKDQFIKLIGGIDLDVEFNGTKNHFCIEARAGIYDIKDGDTMPHVMNCISAAVSAARRHPTEYIVTFTPEVLYKIMHEQEISATFPSALRNREFVVYYQPKVSLETSEICGCEALVRWLRDGKLVPPMEFIPLFERNGSICALDFYMLESVCRNICEWKEKGLEPVTVSINFSKTHLHNPNIADDIIAVINKYGIESKYIEIEMTEMSDYSDYDAFKKLVTRLKEQGVMTSIDDFGTGYSSLNLLTDFMFDIVKLDKSFLDNIIRNNSTTDEIVVRNIVKMIRELDMKVIAEGVETAEQARFLKDINCTMVQGYLFDRPLPESDFLSRLTERKYNSVV
ncbi:MAG: GGDEF domain-containing protein [Oscillospiraceae bacterium]|nr:GGDEF domain-containing protein [Oscillospiraceae bacterium]